MKKGLLKVLTSGFVMASILGSSMFGAFALEPSSLPVLAPEVTESQTAYQTIRTITVKNVEAKDGLKVTAYQLAKGKYNESRGIITGYQYCEGLGIDDISDLENPTSDEITAIANQINDRTLSLNSQVLKQYGKDYKLNAEAGEYLILVTGSNDVIYNPAVVSVNVSKPNDVGDATFGGEVNMENPFKYKNDSGEEVVAYLKSSKPSLDKSVVGSVRNNVEAGTKENNPNGDTIAFGDTVKFKIETTMLSYSEDYTNLTFTIRDRLAKDSFKGIGDLKVYVGGNTEDNKYIVNAKDGENTNYTLSYLDDQGNTAAKEDATRFEVAFTDSYIRSHGNEKVIITYNSIVQETAGYNYAENKNTAELEYSNDPTDETGKGKIKDRTYHYTFAIDAEIDSQSTERTPGDDGSQNEEETNEIIKVTKSGEARQTVEDGENEYITTTSTKALEGATFNLFSNEACTTAIAGQSATSDSKGFLTFKGLDEGVYYLKETEAPPYYLLNEDVYKITIKADLNATTGILNWYSIVTERKKVDSQTQAITYEQVGSVKYTNEYTLNDNKDSENYGDVENHIKVEGGDDDKNISVNVGSVEIVDTKLAELPSTGGTGTIAITVGASVAMAVFLTIHIVNKKKSKIAD